MYGSNGFGFNLQLSLETYHRQESEYEFVETLQVRRTHAVTCSLEPRIKMMQAGHLIRKQML